MFFRLVTALLFWFYSTVCIAAQPVSSTLGMVVTEQALASQVGADILRAGGNAIDAAVAVGYALAVVDPCCGNIGGSGFMTIHLANGKNIFFNFRSRAPLAATRDMFLDSQGNVILKKSTEGYLAVATPGTVMGLETAREKYGTLPREQLIAPAIHLAEKGYHLTERDIATQKMFLPQLQSQPNVAAIFLKQGQLRHVGDLFVQKDLANTLKKLSAQGPAAFYRGDIAKAIVSASQKNHGIFSLNDFTSYYVTQTDPVYCAYHGYTIISSALPSSGGLTLCEILHIIEPYPLKQLGFHAKDSIHDVVEAMRFSYYDRNLYLGDPDFVKIPPNIFLSSEHAEKIRQLIKPDKMTPSVDVGPAITSHEGLQTSHYSVMDKWGNAVSVTYTLNGFFGAFVIAGKTGFFLNNDMDDFAVKPGKPNQYGSVEGIANAIAPGKRPLSSMTPTIVMKNNKVTMITGSPGGPRIITATLQAIINVVDYDMNIQDAVNAPRFHHQWLPDHIDIEADALTPAVKQQLMSMGYQFVEMKPWGAVESIAVDPATGMLHGANDKRRPGGAAIEP